MTLRNSTTAWGSGVKWLHWTIALLIIGSSIFILHVNDSLPWFKSSPVVFITYIHWHKSAGLIALALILARIFWRRSNVVPVTAVLTPFEHRWSHRIHLALYVLMIAVPISGWMASSFFGSPTKFFGLFVIPPITPKWKLGVGIFYWVHFALAWAILSLVAAHASAAIYHHHRRKDGVLRGMLPGKNDDSV